MSADDIIAAQDLAGVADSIATAVSGYAGIVVVRETGDGGWRVSLALPGHGKALEIMAVAVLSSLEAISAQGAGECGDCDARHGRAVAALAQLSEDLQPRRRARH